MDAARSYLVPYCREILPGVPCGCPEYVPDPGLPPLLPDMVRLFHSNMGQRDPDRPVDDPSLEARQLRAHVCSEEYAEHIVAMVGAAEALRLFQEKIAALVAKRGHLAGDLVEITDGASDCRVVACGSDVAFGVNGLSIDRLVMISNLKKAGGGKDPVTGKFLKPPGWQPPAIEAELRAQGWTGKRKENGNG